MKTISTNELQEIFNNAAGTSSTFEPNSIFSLTRFKVQNAEREDEDAIVSLIDEFIGEEGIFNFYFDSDTTIVDVEFMEKINPELITVSQRLDNYLASLSELQKDTAYTLNVNVFPRKYDGRVNISFSNPWYFGITENPASLTASKTLRFIFLNENVDVFSNEQGY